jgi:DNA-directed RNA polymerase I, II, and III subunit RPABC2
MSDEESNVSLDSDDDIDDDEEALQINFDDEEEEEKEEDELVEDIEELEDENIINVSEYNKFEIVSKDKTYERLDSRRRETLPIMTQFEYSKLIGLRATQLEEGMPPCISFDPDIRDTKFIAIQELLQKKMPLIIRRYLPNGTYEDWRPEELLLHH